MTTYFVGGGLDCWLASIAHVSDAGLQINVQDVGYADAILRDPATLAPLAVTELWFHVKFDGADYRRGDIVIMEMRDPGGVPRARLRDSATDGGHYFEWYDGAAWHSTPIAMPSPAILEPVDFYVKIGVAGYIGWFVNGVTAGELTGIDTSSMGSIASIRMYCQQDYYNNGMYEQAIAASYNTIGHTVRQRIPNANGPEQTWDGDYTTVGKNSTNDTTALATSTSDDVSSFAAPALSDTPAGSVIKCVAIGMRVRANGGAPTHVEAGLTIGGVDYLGPSYAGTPGYKPIVACLDNDPSTNAPWASIADANGNIVVKAVA